ncbi:glycoside hydrolase family 35 protein [Streptomyces kanasensis]|uniref:glycoside hydrolase family 35 protein n=1 Tax=Streptomyces kanasensis TaxID=936756 RepID=UPI00381DF766
MPPFAVTPGGFLLDGRPFRVLSGALHYFRVLPPQWPQRLRALRAMGLDTVETYVPWNLHEPRPGEYDFGGPADLDGFLRAVRAEGMYAIVRPSPYVCAEWDNGGLPWWLAADREVRALRCRDPAYLAHVDRWYDRLVPVLAPHQVTRGGHVLMMQVENEYGSYGSDTGYLEHLAAGLRARGVDVPLFTSDGPDDVFLTGGTHPGTPAAVNFGSRPHEAFAALRRLRPHDPPFCMEFWCGWFDHWGEEHVARDAAEAAAELAAVLESGASVNLYMAHGGTNFSTWAGANTADPATGAGYQPTVTSYDYDAPVDERGAVTAKFHAFREVLAAHANGPLPEPEPPAPLLPPSRVALTGSVALLDVLDVMAAAPVAAPEPPSFEELGVAHGLVLYETRVPGPRGPYPLSVHGLADRAHVLVDGRPAGVLERDATESLDGLAVPARGARLALLVESMGRVNYGVGIGDRKGVRRVLHDRQLLHGWTARAVELGHGTPERVPWEARAGGPEAVGPVFLRGSLEVAAPADAHLALPGLRKGYLWVNGFCLGRYWPERGPQRTLYLPWPLLRAGRNELAVLELDGAVDPAVEVRHTPDPGRP